MGGGGGLGLLSGQGPRLHSTGQARLLVGPRPPAPCSPSREGGRVGAGQYYSASLSCDKLAESLSQRWFCRVWSPRDTGHCRRLVHTWQLGPPLTAPRGSPAWRRSPSLRAARGCGQTAALGAGRAHARIHAFSGGSPCSPGASLCLRPAATCGPELTPSHPLSACAASLPCSRPKCSEVSRSLWATSRRKAASGRTPGPRRSSKLWAPSTVSWT